MQLSIISAAASLALLAISCTALASPEPRPQGVFSFTAPDRKTPAGCVTTFDKRFGFENTPAIEGVPPPKITEMKRIPDAHITLSMKLINGVLFDRQGRIGSIVANRQFQFDGPPAQAGAIYTSGWSVCPDEGIIALGDQKVFYQCATGNCKLLQLVVPILRQFV